MNRGHWEAVGAYGLWGLLPIYWKWLSHISAVQILCHRIVWSFFFLFAVVLTLRQWKVFSIAIRKPRVMPVYILAAGLITVNWFVYVWAVNAGFIVETALGYFINPLFSVLIGVIFLRERLRPWQWIPVCLAALGILFLTITYGSPPWIALTLASAWATYGLVKKLAPLGSLHGLTLETAILLLPVLAYLYYTDGTGQGVFLHQGSASDLLLIGAGLATTAPLFLFASAVQRIPLSTIGFLQYIAPTIQFFIGTLIYKEPFAPTRFLGFSFVWAALIILGIGGYLTRRPPPAPELD